MCSGTQKAKGTSVAEDLTVSLSVERRFHEELIELPREHQKRIVRALTEMQHDKTHRSTQLEGYPGIWRREVAPYRILFKPGPGWIHVYSVQHRQGVYSAGVAAPKSVPTIDPPALSPLPEPEETTSQRGGEPVWLRKPSDQAWPIIARAISAESPDDLYDLIDLGLPAELFDRLYQQLTERPPKRPDATNVWLVRRNVIDSFFGRVIRLGAHDRPIEIVAITPWITPWTGARSSFSAFIRYLERFRVRTTIMTRPPDLVGHKNAVKDLQRFESVEISYLNDLHAKFFICDIPPIPFALIGSANSTAKSFTNFEVGVFVRGSGRAESFIRDLQSLTTELLSIGRRIKRRGVR